MIPGPVQAQLASSGCLDHVGSVTYTEVTEIRAGTEASPEEQVPLVLVGMLSVARWTNLGRHLHASMGPRWLAVTGSALGTAGPLCALEVPVPLLTTAKASSSWSLLVFMLKR